MWVTLKTMPLRRKTDKRPRMHTANGELGTKTRKAGMQKGGRNKRPQLQWSQGWLSVERLDTPLRKAKTWEDSLGTKQCTATTGCIGWELCPGNSWETVENDRTYPKECKRQSITRPALQRATLWSQLLHWLTALSRPVLVLVQVLG